MRHAVDDRVDAIMLAWETAIGGSRACRRSARRVIGEAEAAVRHVVALQD